MPAGRPTKYKPEYCKQLVQFFDIKPNKEALIETKHKNGSVTRKVVLIPNKLPTLERFAFNIGVDTDTILAWTKKFPEFLGAYKKAKQLQKDIIIENGMAGLYNPAFAIFVAKNVTDMSNVDRLEHTGKDGRDLTFKVVNYGDNDSV